MWVCPAVLSLEITHCITGGKQLDSCKMICHSLTHTQIDVIVNLSNTYTIHTSYNMCTIWYMLRSHAVRRTPVGDDLWPRQHLESIASIKVGFLSNKQYFEDIFQVSIAIVLNQTLNHSEYPSFTSSFAVLVFWSKKRMSTFRRCSYRHQHYIQHTDAFSMRMNKALTAWNSFSFKFS